MFTRCQVNVSKNTIIVKALIQNIFKVFSLNRRNTSMNEEKLAKIIWAIDLEALMQAWNLLEDSQPEDVLAARDRFIRTFA